MGEPLGFREDRGQSFKLCGEKRLRREADESSVHGGLIGCGGRKTDRIMGTTGLVIS
jgi:hypothetical protein